ncbi:MAG: hypothetical protein ABI379_06380 [Rhodanobacter sp.]
MLQLNPPIPMCTPKGEGFAHILLDYGPESDLYWTVLLTETGEIWTYANKYVRASKNITLGRTQPSKPPSDSASELRDPAVVSVDPGRLTAGMRSAAPCPGS